MKDIPQSEEVMPPNFAEINDNYQTNRVSQLKRPEMTPTTDTSSL